MLASIAPRDDDAARPALVRSPARERRAITAAADAAVTVAPIAHSEGGEAPGRPPEGSGWPAPIAAYPQKTAGGETGDRGGHADR